MNESKTTEKRIYECSNCMDEFPTMRECNNHIVEDHEGDGYAHLKYEKTK